MALPKRGKLSLRETLQQSKKGLDYYAAMSGKPRMDAPIPDAPKKRVIKNPSAENDLEAAVITEVGELLAIHPKVLFAVRQNSGAAYLKGRDGADVPVFFYRWARSRTKMRISDYWGLLTDGRLFAVECKRRDWTKPSDQREREQLEFLLTVRYAGGIGLFATGAQSVVEAFDGRTT